VNARASEAGSRSGADHGASQGRRFGRKLAAAVAVAALAITATAASRPAAAAGPGGSGSFGLTPMPGRDGRAAAYFTMTTGAGHSVTAAALISNTGRLTQALRVSRSTGVTAANGGSAFSHVFQSCAGPGCWLTGLPATVRLPAGTGEKLLFTVRVPAGTAPGQYLAGITAESAATPPSVRVASNGKTTEKAVVIEQVTVGVAITVGPLARMRTRLAIRGVSGTAVGPTARLDIVLENTGQTFARAAVRAFCTADGKRYSFAVNASTILPRDQATIAVNAPGLPMGATAPCTVRVGYGNGLASTATWSGLVTLPAPTHTRIVHTGAGAYSVIPPAGISPWAIALFIVGGLILVTVVVLLIAMRRRGLRT